MKKILSLLVLLPLMAISQTVPADATALENIQITNNTTSLTAPFITVQETNGVMNKINKSDLVNVIEVNDVPSLPLIGEVGKIYVVKNVNKIYRWNGTFYQELAVTDISGKINISEKGVTVATLEGGKIPNSQIPALAISETFPVSSQAQMLALSQADQGDVAIRSDISKSFILRVSPSSVLANWSELLSPIDAVTSVNGKVGVVTLVKADVGLSYVNNTSDANKPISTATQTALDLKENTFGKNTAFNKNFGTTAGTVAEGDDSRLSDSRTPTEGSNNYIQNQNASAQSANMWIGGRIRTVNMALLGGRIEEYYTNTDNGEIAINFSGYNEGTTRFRNFGVYNGKNGSILSIIGSTGAATFSSTVTATSFNGSATLTGTPTAPTATAGTNTTQIATTAFVQANSRPYKVYTALLTQTGTNAPVATVLENTLGTTLTFAYSSTGNYTATLGTGVFWDSKTTTQSNFGKNFPSSESLTSNILVANGNSTLVILALSNGVRKDSIFTYQFIEIRVYP